MDNPQTDNSSELTFVKFADKIFRWGSYGVVFMVVCCAVVMGVYIWSIVEERSYQDKRLKDLENHETYIPIDTVSNNLDSLRNRIDVLQQAINHLQHDSASLELKQAVLKDDVRQETNNIINKVNAWIAFWITVLTFLSIFLPLILQYKNFKEETTRIERELERLKDEKEKLEKVREEYEHETHHLRMNAISHTVQNCIAYSLNFEMKNYDDFMRQRWAKTISEFSKLVTFIFRDYKSFQEASVKGTGLETINKHKEQLLISLLDILILLTHVFRESTERVISHRSYHEIRSKIMDIINDITLGRIYTSNLHTQLTSIIDDLSHIDKK